MSQDVARETGGGFQRNEIQREAQLLLDPGSQLKESPTGHAVARQVEVSGLRRTLQGATEQNQPCRPELAGQLRRALNL